MDESGSAGPEGHELTQAAIRLFQDKRWIDQEMMAEEERLFAEFMAQKIDVAEWYRRFAAAEREWWSKEIQVLGEWQRARMRQEARDHPYL